MTEIRKVLIANRGEIALRVIRACREVGIKTVAVHSTVDEMALHTRFADEAVCIGPGPAPKSYLNIHNLIAAAEISGADAVHPGYGFLSERAEFADAVQKCGMTFIGPDPEHMRLMGDKVQARETMQKAGVPVLPGTGVLESGEQARAAAEKIGLPVILKASAGGGGRGMKIVWDLDKIASTLETAQAEALAAFGCGDMYLERYVQSPRHIEVQIVADKHGGIIDLFERECSVQRRHQKVIEEAPAANFPEAVRSKMREAAIAAGRAISYHSLGTVEFLLDGDQFYFMEMNTRVQVEHCVTEMVTGVDLVQEQLRLAAGEPLGHLQREYRPRGHSIECRLNAEDPVNFAPHPGTITALHLPGGTGVRVDTHVYQGYAVSPYYDSMLGKLIVHAPTREQAIARMRRALGECVIEGISTNIALHRWILKQPPFVTGVYDTHFLERDLDPDGIRAELNSHA
ncbi:Biotin carboxylase of acetyl-CoA carboxylase [Enhygromyxa salina]|uniref:Biotin carboxylase n=1 Tax=Enhygromyxa salina TaxID=215803 RepID=A0A0C2D9T4_9BACT|nr:acetyl-CoA carboxylase biotin carboxylase subunit [Enhygromyxa salina]KIG18320.1 Biotin carboxylase of acetyl-CoA carboxylase [Enhygromyxa salina]